MNMLATNKAASCSVVCFTLVLLLLVMRLSSAAQSTTADYDAQEEDTGTVGWHEAENDDNNNVPDNCCSAEVFNAVKHAISNHSAMTSVFSNVVAAGRNVKRLSRKAQSELANLGVESAKLFTVARTHFFDGAEKASHKVSHCGNKLRGVMEELNEECQYTTRPLASHLVDTWFACVFETKATIEAQRQLFDELEIASEPIRQKIEEHERSNNQQEAQQTAELMTKRTICVAVVVLLVSLLVKVVPSVRESLTSVVLAVVISFLVWRYLIADASTSVAGTHLPPASDNLHLLLSAAQDLGLRVEEADQLHRQVEENVHFAQLELKTCHATVCASVASFMHSTFATVQKKLARAEYFRDPDADAAARRIDEATEFMRHGQGHTAMAVAQKSSNFVQQYGSMNQKLKQEKDLAWFALQRLTKTLMTTANHFAKGQCDQNFVDDILREQKDFVAMVSGQLQTAESTLIDLRDFASTFPLDVEQAKSDSVRKAEHWKLKAHSTRRKLTGVGYFATVLAGGTFFFNPVIGLGVAMVGRAGYLWVADDWELQAMSYEDEATMQERIASKAQAMINAFQIMEARIESKLKKSIAAHESFEALGNAIELLRAKVPRICEAVDRDCHRSGLRASAMLNNLAEQITGAGRAAGDL